MEKVAIEELDDWMGPAAVKRSLGRALGAEDVAVNYYELEPGESFAFGYHAHESQEEIFYVLAGEATFETGEPENGSLSAGGETAREADTVTVGPDELVRFAPGEWQQGYNRGDERVRALAIGAPGESGETIILRECRPCGGRTEQEIEPTDEQDALRTVCLECREVTGRFT